MRTSLLWMCAGLALCCLLSQEAKAQYTYNPTVFVSSSVRYDPLSGRVFASSLTQLDSYTAYYYYSPAAEAYLYDTSISGPIKTGGRKYGYGTTDANVAIDVPGSAYSSYKLVSKHFLSIVQIQYRPDLNRWYDHFNYSQRQPGDYGASATIPPGPLGYGVLILNRDIALGNTNFMLTGATPPPPVLVGPQGPVVRGDVVSYLIQNLANGAQISDWKFIDTGSNPQVAYVRAGSSSSTWVGTAVIGGMVTVKVKYGSRVFDLQGSYAVVDRPNWKWEAVEPTRVQDGADLGSRTIHFQAQHGVGDELGITVAAIRWTMVKETVSDGPNTGFNFIRAITHSNNFGPDSFYWALHPDLEHRDSTFLEAQCGNFNPDTGLGFISAEQLIKNVTNHEVGRDGQSHYLFYKAALADAANNIGLNAEKIIGPPTEPTTQFDARAEATLAEKRDRIARAAEAEPCDDNSASLDPSAAGNCRSKGLINSLDPAHGVDEYRVCPTEPIEPQARFVNNFYLGTLARQPSSSERQTWTSALNQAMAQGQPQLISKAQQLGTTLFQSAEYAGRHRADREYVSDLYDGYLHRVAKQAESDSWTNVVTTQGREAARSGIANSEEFKLMVVRLHPQLFDFDADGRSDIGVFRPSVYLWSILKSSDGLELAKNWGRTYDKLVPGDYDGDRKADFAIWKPASGTWSILRSSDGQTYERQWGASTDKPVPGDFDGDGKADIAVWRPSTGNWYIIRSSDGGFAGLQWGASTDKPVPGDYDGDGKTDIAVFRPSNRIWYILKSSDGSVIGPQWGLSSDRLVPGDYDGDGKAEIAVWRPGNGTWYALNLTNGSIFTKQCGINTDKPVTGDYDGDGKFDPAVWRSSNNTWYIWKSSYGFVTARQWGIAGDRPVPGASAGLSYGSLASDAYGDEDDEPPPDEIQ